MELSWEVALAVEGRRLENKKWLLSEKESYALRGFPFADFLLVHFFAII